MLTPNEFCPKDSVKTYGFLKLNRFFPLPGIYVADEQYVIYSESPPSGQYYFSRGTSYRNVCEVHNESTQLAELLPQATDPESPSDGTQTGTPPGTGDSPQENEDSNVPDSASTSSDGKAEESNNPTTSDAKPSASDKPDSNNAESEVKEQRESDSDSVESTG